MGEKYAEILDDVCDPLTVRKFSEKCSISRQEAIRILEDEVAAKGEPLWALYEVSGLVGRSTCSFLPANEKLTKHIVVPASELEEAKKTFDEVLSTCLHSVQRTNPKDTRVYGRGWARNDDLKGKTLPGQQKRAVKAEEQVEEKPKPVKKVETLEKVVKKEKSPEPVPKKKQANVMSMFAKKQAPKPEQKAKSPSLPPAEPAQKGRKRPKVEIDEPEDEDSFPSSREPSVEKEVEKTSMKTFEKKQTKKKKIVEESDDDQFPSSREQTPEKQQPPPPKRHKKEVNDENRQKKQKKTAKILKPESEDDEEMEEEPTVKKTKTKGEEEERRRTTRIEKVTETYVDEDGYLVSREVSKAVECASSPQKTQEKPKPKVITAPIPGAAKPVKKNATITSFFKKQ